MSKLRRAVRLVHLYVGLTVGLLFSLAGLTGSFLVFYPQIDTWINANVRDAASDARPASYETLYQHLLAMHPERPAHWRIEIPETGGPIQARSLSVDDMAGRQFAPLIVWVDPRDNRVLRESQWGRFFATWIYDLHYRLQLGKTGSIVMGIIGLTTLGLLVTGVWTWWPSNWRTLVTALSYRRRTALSPKLFEIHKLVGVYAGAVLALIVVTGVMISLPDQVQPLLSPLSQPYATPTLASTPASGATRLSIDQALTQASTQLPGSTLKWIDTPRGPGDVYAFRYRVRGEPAIRFPNSVVWIEQYSGAVIGVRDATQDPLASQVVNWEHPLHTGEAFGLPGKWLALLIGLLPATLFVTGVWRWLLRRSPAVPVRE